VTVNPGTSLLVEWNKQPFILGAEITFKGTSDTDNVVIPIDSATYGLSKTVINYPHNTRFAAQNSFKEVTFRVTNIIGSRRNIKLVRRTYREPTIALQIVNYPIVGDQIQMTLTPAQGFTLGGSYLYIAVYGVITLGPLPNYTFRYINSYKADQFNNNQIVLDSVFNVNELVSVRGVFRDLATEPPDEDCTEYSLPMVVPDVPAPPPLVVM
jgi:hypothetical protein